MWLGIALLMPIVFASVCAPEVMTAPSGCTGIEDGQVLIAGQLIHWNNGADTGQYEALRLWCLAVGPPSYMGPSENNSEAVTLDTLIIGSWNTHVGGGELRRFITQLRSGHLTDGKPVRHFVLLLQEVFRQGASVPVSIPPEARSAKPIRPNSSKGVRIDIIETAKNHGLGLLYVPTMRNGKPTKGASPEDRGNAILSTLPFYSPVAVELPLERQRRVAIAVKFCGSTTSGKPWTVQVINVHLENRSHWGRPTASFGAARLNQIKALLEVLPPKIPTVLGGDFNTWFGQSQESAIQFVERFFERTEIGFKQGTVKSGPFLGVRTVDYLFFRIPHFWQGSYRRLDQNYGSDHYPLLGRITFEDRSKD